LNILHIWDQSAVACVLAKNQKKLGHEVKILRRTGYDRYGIYEFYGEIVTLIPEENFLELSLQEANKADLVHIHSRTDALFYIRRKSNKRNKIIMHFHGSDLRGINQKYKRQDLLLNPGLLVRNARSTRVRGKNNLLAERSANKVLYSTADLRKFLKRSDSVLINIPIDTDHFTPNTNNQASEDFFIFNTEAISNMKWIIDYCKRSGIDNLKVIDRMKHPVKYSDMPKFLKQFGTYVDIRYVNDNVLSNLSTTALQSLACGLKVVNYNLEQVSELPSYHVGSNAAKLVQKAYEEIL
jgi:glycosyltransferase involved in cell wall biosynthesis